MGMDWSRMDLNTGGLCVSQESELETEEAEVLSVFRQLPSDVRTAWLDHLKWQSERLCPSQSNVIDFPVLQKTIV